MSYLTKAERVMLPRARKRFGYSCYVGTMFMGFTQAGDDNQYAGIYQSNNNPGKHIYHKKIMYWPTNPQTVPQQAWRAVFTAGAVAWGALTADEKLAYNKRAKQYHFFGYHLFQREWLHQHLLS